MLQHLQQQFMSYLVGKPSEITACVLSTDKMSADARLNIYANAYRLRLLEVLETDFDKLHSYLGDEQFYALADLYIAQFPSETTNIRYFSQNIPNILKQQEPYKDFPVLAELALIEHVFANSFDAADAKHSSVQDLASLPPEQWPSLTLSFHPSLQLMSFDTNAFDTWKALSAEQSPPELVTHEHPQHWMIWRKSDLISHYRPLDDDEYHALKLMMSQQNFSQLCVELLAFHSEQDTPTKAVSFLQTWLNEQMVSQLLYGDNA